MTVHYLAPPAEGAVAIEVAMERNGRMLTFVSGRVTQGDKLVATAQAAFAPPLPGVQFCDMEPPAVPPPDELTPLHMPAGAPRDPSIQSDFRERRRNGTRLGRGTRANGGKPSEIPSVPLRRAHR